MKVSLSLALICCLLFASCTPNAENNGDNQEGSKPEVVKVEPQEFPVNKIPETQFGKVAKWEDVASIDVPDAANLKPDEEKFPDWLDAIISRESIVLFANTVLSQLEEEVEFVQAGQQHYAGPEGWKAFHVQFNTRPSNANMVIFGAYKSESESYWGSDFSKLPLNMTWTNAAPSEMGVQLLGNGYYGGEDKAATFSADLGKEALRLNRAM